MKKISRVFSLLLTVALLLGCVPSMQVFAAETPTPRTEGYIWTTDGVNNTSGTLSRTNIGLESDEQHYYKDITLQFSLGGTGAPTVKVQGHTFTSFTYSDGAQFVLELKDVQAYASPTNNGISIEVSRGGRSVYVFVRTFYYTSPDTSKPYLEGRDMWDWDSEQLPNVYSPVVIAQKAHRYTYSFRGALIMPDAENYRVTLDGNVLDVSPKKQTDLGYGMGLYEFSLYPVTGNLNPDADGYSTVEFVGTNAFGYENRVVLKCRFVYR